MGLVQPRYMFWYDDSKFWFSVALKACTEFYAFKQLGMTTCNIYLVESSKWCFCSSQNQVCIVLIFYFQVKICSYEFTFWLISTFFFYQNIFWKLNCSFSSSEMTSKYTFAMFCQKSFLGQFFLSYVSFMELCLDIFLRGVWRQICPYFQKTQ